jgi:hypothetical protein
VQAINFVSSNQLAGVVPTAFLRSPVTAQVLVETGDPMGETLVQGRFACGSYREDGLRLNSKVTLPRCMFR